MASRTQRSDNLVGGMQLLPPSDRLQDGASLIVQNFRADQLKLVSRRGSTLRAGPIGSGVFHTLKRTDNNEYGGIGEALYHGPFLGTEVADGFDGKPLGMAFYRGAGWVMNRGRRLRVFAHEGRNWGVAAPSSAPTATGGGQLSTEAEEWDEGANVTVGIASTNEGEEFSAYAMQGGSPVDNDVVTAEFDTENKKSGGASLKLTIQAATSVSAFSDGVGSLLVDGQAQDEDVIRVWVFASNPRAVESVTVFVRSPGGYAEYCFQDASKWLNQSLNSWTQLKIRRRLNLDDWGQRITQATVDDNQQTISDIEAQFATAVQTPTFVYTGSGWPHTGIGAPPASTYPPSEEMLALDWAGIDRIGVSVKVKEPVVIGIDRAEAVGTVGENSSGAITYYVSFVTINGEDGNPSPPSNPVVAGTQTITLSGIPTSDDPSVVARFIYRLGGGLSQPYRVGVIGDNSTTGPWEDHTSNRIAQRDNIVMPVDRDLPPAASGVIGPIFGKLIAYSTATHPARLFWTKAAIPWAFPGADDEDLGNWEDSGADDDPILAATDHRPVTVFYKRRSIWRLNGDPEELGVSPSKTNANVGIVGPNAVVDGGGVDYFVGAEGVYRFNLDFEEKISQTIDPIFKGDYVPLNDGTVLPPISLDYAHLTTMELVGDRLRVSYAEHGFSSPNVIAVYHIDTGRWTREVYALEAPAFTALLNQGPGALMAGATGSDGGYLYWLELQGFWTDAGTAFPLLWQSRFEDQGLPDNFKIYTDLEVDCQTLSGSSPSTPLSVAIVFDNGTIVNLGTIQSSDTQKPRFTAILRLMDAAGANVGRRAKNASIRITGSNMGPVILYGVYLHWYPEERVARSFDSGPTHLGLPERVKQVDHVELYLTAAGQAMRRRFDSDLPGNVLTNREDIDFDAPAGRGTFRRRLGSIVEGRNFRLTISEEPSGATFQVHQARVRMRPIGEYLDGSNGDWFESAEFSIAPGRVGELKDLLLDYDVSGPGGRIEIYSDLPGNAMTLRRTLALPVRDRAPYVFPFEDPTLTEPSNAATGLPHGQLFKVRIYPPAGGICRLHGRAMLRARLIGVYFDGTSGEIWETQPLDLAGGLALFREVSLIAQTEGPMHLEMRCELPDDVMRTVASIPVPTTASRIPLYSRLPGNTKGRLQQFRLVGSSIARVFGLKVLGRRTELPDSPWTWADVPLELTPDAWAELNLPVRATPEDFVWVDLPVDEIG